MLLPVSSFKCVKTIISQHLLAAPSAIIASKLLAIRSAVYACKIRKILSMDPEVKLISLRSVGYKLVELGKHEE